jgi:YD repeat-containing protein
MHKDAATIIHAKNPHLCVASGAPQGKSTSTTTGSAAYLNGFLSLLDGQDVNGHDFVDIVGYHMYLNSCGSGINCSPSDQTAGTLVDEKWVRQVMTNVSAHMAAKPLQDTEWAPVSGVPDNLGGNQAQFLATAYIIQLSNGDRGVYWYNPDVSPISGIYSLYTSTAFSTLNAAGNAWNWVRSNTLGKTPSGPCVATYTTGSRFTCDYTDANSSLYRFAWDAAGTSGATTTASGFTHYQTFDGVTHSVSGTTVPIGRDPVLLMP